MYAQVMGINTTSQTLMALNEEPGFRGFKRLQSGEHVALWESAATAHRPNPDRGGRLLNVYRASGRPA